MIETRTQAIAAAIARELKDRQPLLDRSDDIGSVTITVKLNAPSAWVRGVIWEEERVSRTRNGG